MMRRAPLARRTRLRYRSRKTEALYRSRRRLVAELLAEPTRCQVPGCTRLATDPHEPLTRARGGSIFDPANVTLICRPHHREITDTEPAWAYELGLLVHSWEAR